LSAGAEPTPPIRAFLALELPQGLRDALCGVVEALRAQLPGVRWVDPSGIHLTLRFLGWAAPERLARVQPAVAVASTHCPPLEVAVGGGGLFPERGSPRVIWVGARLPEAARTLQAACEAAAVAEGFPAESRPFHPHLTLGRWKDRARRPSLPPVDLGTWTVDRLVLYQSRPGPAGSVYTALAEFPLAR
jgi:RNA 2',3'-cyclic 3'-phosphodiesterase